MLHSLNHCPLLFRGLTVSISQNVGFTASTDWNVQRGGRCVFCSLLREWVSIFTVSRLNVVSVRLVLVLCRFVGGDAQRTSSDGWNANRNIESRSLGVLYCSDAARDVSLLNYCQQFFYCYYNWRCISQDTNRTSFWPLLAAFLSDFTVEKHSWPQFCLNVGFWNQSDDLYLEVFHSSSFHPQNRTTNSWTTKCSSPTWFCSVKRNQSESEEGPSAVTLKKR